MYTLSATPVAAGINYVLSHTPANAAAAAASAAFALDQMERARAILQKLSGGYGKVCIMIDYVGLSIRNASPMKTSMKTLGILQNHYPETLGVAYFVSPPFVFRSFWKVSRPSLDK